MTREEIAKMQLVQKSRSGILRIIFGRTAVILALIVLQAFLLFNIIKYFQQYVPAFFGGNAVFAFFIVLYIINKGNNPSVQLSWTILTLLTPVVGGLLYLYVETHPGQRILEKRLEKLYRQTQKYVKQDNEVVNSLKQADIGTARMADYVRKHGNFSIYQNTQVTYLPLGEAKLEAMIEELEKAKHFIFMEYFILARGIMWERILEILQRKVGEGVEVRLMYDGTCAVSLLPYDYPEMLKKIGIRCKMFAPLKPILSTHYNNRDHRKILVIDGKVGFTGGINIGDEYINHEERFGHWKDTAVLLKGDAVEGLTQMFLQMWNVNEKAEDYSKYLCVEKEKVEAQGFVMPYGDSPFDEELIGEMVYMDILNRAEHYVHIMSPYLILDHEMVTALTYAGKRGVDVKLMLPHIPDKILPFALAKSHYKDLIRAGVKIYEYTPGFVHAKVFVSDDIKAVVGTINLDYRSLYLHFECAAFLYGVPEIQVIERDYQETLEKCRQITLEDCEKEKIYIRILGKLLKVVAPLM
ncbi:cardiolipin synthase [Anaerotignum sp. MB30-C6]|uniref:cardiolipin synthase n=1 Tax=Anaerotignum sp. MB30-C6 TaxID=3070814 RepID=UPI0027DD0BBB|nr:cardiolipin synthase [Anaerotignum sp. MB30-C6]WMI80671.1 cardiolipin synthase [Anaerotignum sp. MB30-C6]